MGKNPNNIDVTLVYAKLYYVIIMLKRTLNILLLSSCCKYDEGSAVGLKSSSEIIETKNFLIVFLNQSSSIPEIL